MVESTPAILNAQELTEHERRLKRAARFGMDASEVIGPSATSNDYDKMNLPSRGQVKVDKLNENIQKIKMRQQKFADEVPPEAETRIENLEKRIDKLHNVSKPEEIKQSAKIILDLLYFYGTDFMSTDEIKMYFMKYPEIEVRWINDSSCTLKFQSDLQAAEAYHQFSMKPVEADQSLGFDERNFDSRIGWREAIGYQHDQKGWQNLWIRYATDLDEKKPETKGQDSRFYRFQKNIKKSSFQQRGIQKKEKYVRKLDKKTEDQEMKDETKNMELCGTE